MLELKSIKTEMKKKKSVEANNSRYEQVEERMLYLKIGQLTLSSPKNIKENKGRKINSLTDLWDTIKYASICLMVVPEGESHKRKNI